MTIRFPSVQEAMGRAREAVRRFPFVILSGTVAAVAACIMLNADDTGPWIRATEAALLGLPLFTALSLTLERRGAPPAAMWLTRLAGTLVPIGFFLWSANRSDTILITTLFHIAILLHLAVAVVPFVGHPGRRGFWQFNRILFLRFLTGGLFTAVLFAGLALALAALNPLFNIDVDEDVYVGLFFILAFLVSPWYFAAGVPRDLDRLDGIEDYPIGLRVFAQFILMPLVVVYLLLLTTYLGRVLLTRTWPSGWIGWLVSGVAVAGTLALLLVDPLRDRGGKWVDTYNRWFFVALLPSIAMLLAAILQRVGQYGLTERRYFLLVLALVLAGVALFYAITASRNIRVIPAALLAAALVTLVGPWSAYAVSERSQRNRIIDVLERNAMLSGGTAIPSTTTVSVEDRRQMSGALQYLLETRGPPSVTPLLVPGPTHPDSLRIRRWQAVSQAAAIMDSLGLRFVDRLDADEYLYLNAANIDRMLDVAGWDRLLEADFRSNVVGASGADSVILRPSPTGLLSFHVWHADTAVLFVDLTAPLTALLERNGGSAARGAQLPVDDMTFDVESASARARILLQHLNAVRTDSGYTVQSAQGRILLQFR